MATQTTTTQYPAGFEQALQSLWGRANTVSNQTYQPYVGANGQPIPRVAGFTPDQNTAFNQIRNVATAGRPNLTTAAGMIKDAGNASALGSASPYFNQAAGLSGAGAASPLVTRGANASSYGAAQPLVTQGTGSWTNNAAAYMSPYTQQVTDRVADLGARNLSEKFLPAVNDTFIGSGQFGSSRNSDFTQRAVRDTQESVLGQQSQALENGYATAANIYGQDASRQLQGGLGLGALLGQDASRQVQAGLGLGQLTGADADRLASIGSQTGSLANADAARRLQAGNSLTDFVKARQGIEYTDAGALGNIGQQQQGLNQQNLDTLYSDFTNQRDYNRDNLSWLNGILNGTALPNTQTTKTSGSGNTLGTIGGLLTSGISLLGGSGAFGSGGWLKFSEGGLARQPYARGGLAHFGKGGRVERHPSSGRPVLHNDDGTISTEESITVTDQRLNGGRPTNIPTIWGGRRPPMGLDDPRVEDYAVDQALGSGLSFPSFESIDDAVAAAVARSRSLGDEYEAVGGLSQGAGRRRYATGGVVDQGRMAELRAMPFGELQTYATELSLDDPEAPVVLQALRERIDKPLGNPAQYVNQSGDIPGGRSYAPTNAAAELGTPQELTRHVGRAAPAGGLSLGGNPSPGPQSGAVPVGGLSSGTPASGGLYAGAEVSNWDRWSPLLAAGAAMLSSRSGGLSALGEGLAAGAGQIGQVRRQARENAAFDLKRAEAQREADQQAKARTYLDTYISGLPADQQDQARAAAAADPKGYFDSILKQNEPTSEMREYRQAQSEGFKGSFLDYQIGLKQAGRSVNSTNVMVNGDNELQKQLGKNIADDIAARRGVAASAISQLSAVNEAKTLLDSGIISGSGAEWKLALDKALSGVGFADGTKVANTEAFIATMGRQTLDLVKSLGAGSGISNADRDYAEKVAGGNITLNEASIRKIIDINERAARAAVTGYNKSVEPIISDKNTPDAAKAYLRVPEPQPRAMTRTEPAPTAAPKASDGIPRFASPSDPGLQALPSGARFYDANGVLRRKP